MRRNLTGQKRSAPDLKRALAYIAPHRRRLAIVVFASLVGTALTLYQPYLTRILVDQALIGRDLGKLTEVVLLFIGITLTSFAINIASGLTYTRVSADILFAMRLDVYRHLQKLSPRFYAQMPLGQIVSRINSDIGEIQRVAAELVLAWIGNLLFLIGSIAMLVYLDLRLFAISLVLLPPAIWTLVRYRRRLDPAIADMRNCSADIGSFLIETLQGMRVTVAANAQEREVERFRRANDAFVDSLMRMQRLTYFSGGLPALLLGLGGALVFWYGGSRVIEGTLSMGTLVAFIAYQMRLMGPVQGLMSLYASVATARVSLRRVHQILDAPVEVRPAREATKLTRSTGHLLFDEVSFSFGRGAAVLDGFSLEIEPGDVVALVGESGGGKSTIADLLIRQLDVDSGRIMLDGHDLRQLRLEDLRRVVVVVDQDTFVFNATMRENIRYARPDASSNEVLEAARAAGLGELVARLPEGLDTQVGERGRALSAGERQRIAIARAFLTDPAVLVLDEATSALDPETEAQVIAGYQAIMRNRTTLLITHRMELTRIADRVIVLENGRAVAAV